MLHHKCPLVITPVCQQTSFLENKSSLGHVSTKYELDWITFVNTYRPTGLKYETLKKECELFLHMKSVVEDDFEKCFGIRIPIYEKRYIIERFKALNP